MANMADCMQAAVSTGELSPSHANQAKQNYQQLVARYASSMPPHEAAVRAAADLKEATRRSQRARFHSVVNQLQSMRRLETLINEAPDPALAIRQLMEWSEGSAWQGESVAKLTEAYMERARATMYEALREIGPNVVGSTRSKTMFMKIVRELHGEVTGDALARKLAQSVDRAREDLRKAFNAHGGDVAKLDRYGMPHAHDAALIRSAGFQSWRDAIYDRLDWHRIINARTGKPFAVAEGGRPLQADADAFLENIYENISTNGWNGKSPSLSPGGRALYNTRADHRVLHFKSADDWIEYNKEFGAGDPLSALLNGINGVAQDVALMRVLGPNPKAGLDFAIQVAEKRATYLTKNSPPREPSLIGRFLGRKSETALDRVQSQAALTRAMLAHQDGSANVPANIGWARFFSATRAFLASAQLGSAALSSVSDEATIRVAAKVIGMNPNNIFVKGLGLVRSQATRDTAARMGFVAETLADAGGGTARYFGKLFGTGITDRLAGFAMRATGLSFITDMRRLAFQMEFAGYMAENANRSFDKIDDSLRQILEGRGVTARDWDLLRDPSTRFIANNGSDFISPFYWLETQTAVPRAEAEGLAMRLHQVIREQLEFAIPSSSLEGRARLQGQAQPGTVSGELLRSVGAYKSFALSLTMNQYRRAMSRPTPMSKAMYAAETAAFLVLTGAVAIQLKELSKGRDPRPMDETKFWGAAVMQSGGLGIFGDFFAAESSRAGGGLAETIAGPVVGFAGDVMRAGVSNASRIAEGKGPLIGRDVSNLVRRNTPFLSSAWYGRLGFDRLVADTLQGWLDPDAEAQWKRQQRRIERDYGTQSWWAPGDKAPGRAPDLGNAFGGSE